MLKNNLIIISLLFALTAYAKQVDVNVIQPNGNKNIVAEVTNITQGTQIDVSLPLTATEKATAKTSFGFNDTEAEVMDNIAIGGQIDANNIGIYVTSLKKMISKRGLSNQEIKELFLSDKKAKDVNVYFYKKEKLENI